MAGGLAESLKKLKSGQYLCSLYGNDDQQFSIVVPFIKHGLDNGEKCIYIADESSMQGVKSSLRKNGVDVQRYIDSGQLTLTVPEETYLKSEDFRPEDIVNSLNGFSRASRKSEYRGARVATEMTWALKKPSILARIAEYEAKIDRFLPGTPVVGLCQYNKEKFGEKVLLDVIRSHPVIVLDGYVCDNLYYVPRNELGAKDELDRYLKNVQNQLGLPGMAASPNLEEKDREVADKLLKVILELDDTTREAFAELFGKKRYGCFSFIFKAGDCIGFDWKSSHRR